MGKKTRLVLLCIGVSILLIVNITVHRSITVDIQPESRSLAECVVPGMFNGLCKSAVHLYWIHFILEISRGETLPSSRAVSHYRYLVLITRLFPTSAYIYYIGAQAFQFWGQYHLMEKILRRGIRARPKDVELMLLGGFLFSRYKEDNVRAYQIMEPGLTVSRRPLFFDYYLADIYSRAGEPAKARHVLTDLLQRDSLDDTETMKIRKTLNRLDESPGAR